MAKVRSWAGLDVHAAKVVAVTVDGRSGELRAHRLSGETAKVVAFCAGPSGPTRVAYEAGPTGFGLARALGAAGVACVIAAPGKIERAAQDRVKTDRRDAERLVRLLMVDGLHAVRVPSGEEEALRDLVRAREEVRGDLMRVRHRMGELLLRHDVRYDGAGENWTTRHRDWLRSCRARRPWRAGHPARPPRCDRRARRAPRRAGAGDRRAGARLAVGADGRPVAPPARDRHAHRGRTVRRDRRLRALRAARPACQLSRRRPIRGLHWPTAAAGSITKTGSRHARRLLVEAAWHPGRPPRRGKTLASRQADQPAHVLALAWKAQQRLHHTWRRLDHQRGKRRTLVTVAVGAEIGEEHLERASAILSRVKDVAT